MDFSKTTLIEAMKLGFLMGLASPVFALFPSDAAYTSKQAIQKGLEQDELKVLADYGYEISESK